MKLILKISLLLNLGLTGCLIFIWTNQRQEEAAPELSSEAKAGSPPQAVAVSTPPIVRQAKSKPFHWNQLESTNDYRVYVANLRAIGCPEPTVQDIVRGDAERGFSFERNQLGLDGSGSSKWSRLQEAQTVATLLGEPIPAAEISAPAQSADNRTQPNGGSPVVESTAGTQITGQPSEVSAGTQNANQSMRRAALSAPAYPLVFQNVNADMGLNDNQKTAIQQLQQQFVNDIGGPNQDPSSPAYLASWQNAQNNADNMLLIYVGWQIYSKYQIMAWQNSLK
jgi:hypothetical protein